MPGTKVVSLSYELMELRHAVDAGRLLAEALKGHGFSTELDERQAPTAICSVLNLIERRLLELTRAIRGLSNPEQLWAPYNDALPESEDPEDQDLRLRPWTDEECAAHARRELQRATARLQRAGGGRRKGARPRKGA